MQPTRPNEADAGGSLSAMFRAFLEADGKPLATPKMVQLIEYCTVAFRYQCRQIRAGLQLRRPVAPQLSQTVMVKKAIGFHSQDSGQAPLVWSNAKSLSLMNRRPMVRRVNRLGVLLVAMFASFATAASAQTVRQWSGTNALTRQPEQVLAATMAEWRSLWSRVGMAAPDMFEPGRTSAVGIFLGMRTGPGYSVNILSASRRRDRIMVVFEERAPDEVMMAERLPPVAPPPAAPRPVATGPSFAAGGASAFAPSGTTSLATPVAPQRPSGPPTSPWAIVLINRVDLPITVEQRLFR
jgi:hypothetical protein